MTRVYLLRHGETAWNADGNRYCGRTDLPLSAVGRAQAAALRQALARLPLTAIYVSPLARSRDTGEIIAAGKDVPLAANPRLIEIDFGTWEGLTAAEIASTDPAGREAWLRDPATTRAGGTGETGAEVSDRMRGCLGQIATEHPGSSIAVVGHNTANRLYLAASLAAPLASYRRLVLSNASISVLEVDDGDVRWLRVNDISHFTSEAIDQLSATKETDGASSGRKPQQ